MSVAVVDDGGRPNNVAVHYCRAFPAENSGPRFAPAYARLQRVARECLQSADHNETFWRKPVDPEFETATVSLCATCGQVEAPQSCLGICIRRNGEFLRADHYVELAAQIETMQRRAHDLIALVRQLARVAPHAGQYKKTCRAFQEKAIKLLDFTLPAKRVSLLGED
jgi:hypothetical protein